MDYIINAGMSTDNLSPILASLTEEEGIKDAKRLQKFYNYTEVVYMPEDDEDINEVVWRSWND